MQQDPDLSAGGRPVLFSEVRYGERTVIINGVMALMMNASIVKEEYPLDNTNSSLHDMLLTLMNDYASEHSLAEQENNYKHPFGNLVRKSIAHHIADHLNGSIYEVKGSVGAGRWTTVPWIAVRDKRIAPNQQKGVYIVYLLNKDTKTLYLTLNQGATDGALGTDTKENDKSPFVGIAALNGKKNLSRLREKAVTIRQLLTKPDKASFAEIDTGSKAYDAGCVFSISYTPESLPSDDVLMKDLMDYVSQYKAYYEIVSGTSAEPVIPREESSESPVFGYNQRSTADFHESPKDAIGIVKEYIASQGFSYPEGMIENFYLSLKSKPFVILAGTSGTGKTRLVELFAKAIGAKYRLISVRPDWSDGSDLFGHRDLNGTFLPGPICDAFDAALGNPDEPVLVCLDEMNLARVEYYLSDYLSVIESRKKENGAIKTAKIAQYEAGIPDNLYIIGTVNMDETTFPFSKKVLDRANTIEFNNVNLMPDFGSEDDTSVTLSTTNRFLRAEYLILNRDCAEEAEYVKMLCSELEKINKILAAANAHVGYRLRD